MATSIAIPRLEKPLNDEDGYFRSASLIFATDWEVQESWLEAQLLRPDLWQVRKVSYNLAEFEAVPAQGDPARLQRPDHFKVAILHKEVPLLTALKTLAQFEKDHIALGTATAGRETAATLGKKHYMTYGLSQAVAFDEETGLPSATLRGQIVQEGVFSDKTRSAVREAWEKAQLSPHSDMVRGMFEQRRIDNKSLGAYLSVMDDYTYICGIRQQYQEVMDCFTECTSYQFKYSSDISKFSTAVTQMKTYGGTLPAPYKTFTKTLAELAQVAFDIVHEQAELGVDTDMRKGGAYSERFMDKVDSIVKMLRQNGLSIDAPSVTATMLKITPGTRPDVPPILHEMNGSLAARVRDLSQSAAAKRRDLIR